MSAPAPVAAAAAVAPAPTPAATTAPATAAAAAAAVPANGKAADAANEDSDSSSGSESEDEEEVLDEFLYKEKQEEKRVEVKRILSTFKLNPLQILGLGFNATSAQVKAAYRKISLMTHPDKCDEDFRPDAVKAFALLAQCKTDLLDEAKRGILNELIAKAHGMVIAKKRADWTAKIKAERAAKKAAQTVGFLKEKEEPWPKAPDFTQDADLNTLVMTQTNELIIDREWQKKQLIKAATKEETFAQKFAAEAKAERDAKEAEQKAWEKGRESRIGSWRNFMKKGKKSKSKSKKRKIGLMRMPRVRAEDGDASYVRRPVKKRG